MREAWQCMSVIPALKKFRQEDAVVRFSFLH